MYSVEQLGLLLITARKNTQWKNYGVSQLEGPRKHLLQNLTFVFEIWGRTQEARGFALDRSFQKAGALLCLVVSVNLIYRKGRTR